MSDQENIEEEYVEIIYEEEEDYDESSSGDDYKPQSNFLDFSILFQRQIREYNKLMVQNQAEYYNKLTVNIPSSAIPLYLQSVLSLEDSPILLTLEIVPENYSWKNLPNYSKVKHPIYDSNFVAIGLVEEFLKKFFTKDYKPKTIYKSAPYLLIFQGVFTANDLDTLIEEGYDPNIAAKALLNKNGNISEAREYIKQYPNQDIINPNTGSNVPIKIYETPLYFLVLEICDIYHDLSDHCCICHAPLNYHTVKPTICNNELCKFGFERLGIGNSLIQEMKRDPIIADLLISTFATAVGTQFLNPKPTEFTDSDMASILSSIPSVPQMTQSYNTDKELCKLIGVAAYSLLRWILFTNKSHFISLPHELILPIAAKNQFLTIISDDTKEDNFRKLRAQHGSLFLWHGSAGDRWYPILRNGLKVLSKTQLQLHGNAHGDGIYLAKKLNTSINYNSSCPNKYKNSTYIGRNVNLIALCEVIKDPSKLKDNDWCHVLTDEKNVIVRFLFNNIQTSQYDTIEKPFRKIPAMKDIIKYYSSRTQEAIAQQKREQELREN